MKFTVFENSKSENSKKGPVLYKMEIKAKTVFENRKSENGKKGRFLYKDDHRHLFRQQQHLHSNTLERNAHDCRSARRAARI